MSTISLKLRYRPLRLGWCVTVGDIEAFRRAARMSFTMWGGRYNPIIPVDNPALAEDLAQLFRVDALVPMSDADGVKEFIEKQKHLPWPFCGDDLFVMQISGGNGPRLADISHPISRMNAQYYKNNPAPEPGLDLFEWEEDDPLADVFLCSYGAFPSSAETGIDYRGLAQAQLLGVRNVIQKGAEIQPQHPARETIASLNRYLVETHYMVRNHWDHPGFYIGEADNFSDLVNFWNLRAAAVPVQFFDPRHHDRLHAKTNYWASCIRSAPPRQFGPQGLALWHRRERAIEGDQHYFGDDLTICSMDGPLWNGMNLKAPFMYFGESSALASVSENGKTITASFALTGKPFVNERDTHDQRYVLSVDPGIVLFQNEKSTLHTPFIPQLNEFYGRNAHFIWNEARAEPNGLGIVTSVSSEHQGLRALDVPQLIAATFDTVGIEAETSRSGLVANTLIRQMGGLQGCRPFKISGVRRLIENHRPDQSFDRGCAMQTIQGQLGDRPLSDYQWLYIEPRKIGSTLTNGAVLSYLLEKGVFRAGLKFDCPSCRLEFWLSIDDTKSRLECEYCGHEFNAGPQLRDKAWAFRRSGLFGRDDHQEGAIPVLLTLQQLVRMNGFREPLFNTAMTLKPKGAAISLCETDFVLMSSHPRNHRIQIAIGECKTRKPITAADVENLKAVADSFPSDRYDTFIVFSKLAPFTPDEIELVKSANAPHQQRVILFTDRELEPYCVYERTAREYDIRQTAVSYEDLVLVTEQVFFRN